MTEANLISHLASKLDDAVEATLQVAPDRSEAYFALMSFALMSFALMSLRINVTKPDKETHF
jgi:hypothetical protein